MSDRKMASLIGGANHRVVVATPAVRQATVEALKQAIVRLGHDRVGVVLDCDEEVFRLGYGDIEAVNGLRAAGCHVRQSSALRIGVLVCDECAWVFAPTALYVQPEVQSEETPNAVSMAGPDVERIVGSVLPIAATHQAGKSPAGTAGREVEIGHEEVAPRRLEDTRKALEQAPPVRFDIARQVRVFESYLQYVELSLTGAAIHRHRIRIPKALQRLGSATDLEGRLRTTFDLIAKNSALSSAPLESELREIRDGLTQSLGKDHGRVVLKSVKPLLRQRLDSLRTRLDAFQAQMTKQLQGELDRSRDQVIDYYLPLAKAKPPDVLLGHSLCGRPTDEGIRNWLKRELEKVIPAASDLLGKMTLEERYKDVTFETLNRPDFLESLKRAYHDIDWQKPYEQFKAAAETDGQKRG